MINSSGSPSAEMGAFFISHVLIEQLRGGDEEKEDNNTTNRRVRKAHLFPETPKRLVTLLAMAFGKTRSTRWFDK